MIRVLQVHGAMEKGGTESVIMNLYRNIDRSQIQFDFTTFTKAEAAYDEEIISLGGKLNYVDAREKVGNFNHIKQLYGVIKNNQYKVIHTHMNFHGGIVALVGKLAGANKIICHAHNSSEDVSSLKRNVEIKILRFLMRRLSNQLIACSKEAGDYVFGEKSDYIILNNAVDLNRFYPIECSKEENDDFIKIVHIGRFSLQKNHEGIIKILKSLKDKNIKFKAYLVGEGELFESIQGLVDSNELNENVEFLGLINNVNELLNKSNVFILPSLYEGSPVAMIEAEATGIACFVADTISRESDIGIGNVKYINNDDIEKWVSAILEYEKYTIKNSNIIKEKFKKSGYDLDENIKVISNIYLNN